MGHDNITLTVDQDENGVDVRANGQLVASIDEREQVQQVDVRVFAPLEPEDVFRTFRFAVPDNN